VHGLTVLQQYNPQEAIFGLGNGGPPANAAVFLDHLLYRIFDHALNPFQLDFSSVGAPAHCLEIIGELHSAGSSSIFGFASGIAGVILLMSRRKMSICKWLA